MDGDFEPAHISACGSSSAVASASSKGGRGVPGNDGGDDGVGRDGDPALLLL